MKININIISKFIESILSNNLFLLIVFILLFIIGITYIKKLINKISLELKSSSHDIKEEIKTSVQSKFIQLSPETEVLIQLSIDFWRLERKIFGAKKKLTDKEKQSFDFSTSRIKNQLSKFDIEIKDYTQEKYYEGLNVDVISAEKHKTIKEPVIKETIEPAIIVKGQLVKRAKVILFTN